MGALEQATETQKRNIEQRTGRTFDELVARARDSGLEKHGQIVKMLKTELGMGHGDANLVAHVARAAPAAAGAPADAWYSGKKAAQRPLHDRIVAQIAALGDDIEHAPKKTYLSLRRKRQFAMVGPAARGTVEVGVNLKGADGDERMQALGPGKMCTHRTRVSTEAELDDALLGWLRRAYDAAG